MTPMPRRTSTDWRTTIKICMTNFILFLPDIKRKGIRSKKLHGNTAGAEGRTRTGTRVAPQQFLRLPRLPFRHFGAAILF
jgi:hypothetical protein